MELYYTCAWLVFGLFVMFIEYKLKSDLVLYVYNGLEEGLNEDDVFKALFFEIILAGLAFTWPIIVIYCRVVKWRGGE